MFFKHFAGKNQLPGFYISETLVENGLSCTSFFNKTIKWQIKIIKATITEVILSSGGWFPYSKILMVSILWVQVNDVI